MTAKRPIFMTIVWLITFVIFVFTSLTLVLYALGYRFNISKRTLENTGGIVLKTRPKNATITLDGETITNKTPAQILGLSKGNHYLKVELNNHISWEKTISVVSGLVNDFSDIILFNKNPDTRILMSGLNFWLANDNHTIAALEDDMISLFDTISNQKKILFSLTKPDANKKVETQWSTNGNKLIISVINKNSPREFFVVDKNNPTNIFDLTKLIPQEIKKVVFKPNQNDAYILSGSTLYLSDINKNSKTLIAKNISQFYIQNSNHILLQSSNNNVIMTDSLGRNRAIIGQLNNDNLIFAQNNFILTQLGNLYFTSNKMTKIDKNVHEVTILDDNSALYVKDIGEIRIFKDGISKIITRYAGPVTLVGYFNNYYPLFIQNNLLYAIDAEGNNQTLLAKNVQKAALVNNAVLIISNSQLKIVTLSD